MTYFTIASLEKMNQCIELTLQFKETEKAIRIKISDFTKWLEIQGRMDNGYGTLSTADYFKQDQEVIHLDLHDYIVKERYKLIAKTLEAEVDNQIRDFLN